MHVHVMPSLGDAIYHRPFVREFATSIDTQWHDLFCDLNLTEGSNTVVRPYYDTKSLIFHSVPGAIARFFPEPEHYVFDLPLFDQPHGKYAVIRPPTLRKRFNGPARNPKAEYINQAAKIASGMGLDTVGIGNISNDEWFHGEPPDVDQAYWHGMSVPDLLGLIRGASLVIAGPGWTVPAAIAYQVPHVIVYGGAAKWNALSKLTESRMDTTKLAVVEPDKFCMSCRDIRHQCDKTITNFERKFIDAFDRAMCLRQ